MIHTNSYYVKSEGIKLPDGTVWGAGTEERFRVVDETGIPGFLVYEVFGKGVVNVFGSGNRVSWREMKKALDERFAHQISVGNKVLRCDGAEITEI